jgi:hypothetical protein
MIDKTGGGEGWMGKKTREDESTKDFTKAAKAMGKPPIKDGKKLAKINKRLSRNEKI